METKLVLQNKTLFGTQTSSYKKLGIVTQKPILSTRIVAVTTRPNITEGLNISTESKGDYKDSWFDRIAIKHLSQSVQTAIGTRNEKSGYESLVEAARETQRRFNPIQQRQLVTRALDMAFPSPILSLIRTLMQPSKFSREYFAVFTTIFFPWLVGPCEVRESEFNGRRERNVVHIKKCRFLEESNCVGMCTNLCMMPSQAFIKNSLGVPVNMVPNFDDMSCQMIYGEEPPLAEDDPAFNQPCYKLCKVKQRHSEACPN